MIIKINNYLFTLIILLNKKITYMKVGLNLYNNILYGGNWVQSCLLPTMIYREWVYRATFAPSLHKKIAICYLIILTLIARFLYVRVCQHFKATFKDSSSPLSTLWTSNNKMLEWFCQLFLTWNFHLPYQSSNLNSFERMLI